MKQPGRVPGRSRDVQAGLGEQSVQPLAQQHGILGDDHAQRRHVLRYGHGGSASRRVPPPGRESIRSVPPTDATR
jgi:hypothetical protein